MLIIRERRNNIICGCGLSADLNLADANNPRMQISNIHTPLRSKGAHYFHRVVGPRQWGATSVNLRSLAYYKILQRGLFARIDYPIAL